MGEVGIEESIRWGDAAHGPCRKPCFKVLFARVVSCSPKFYRIHQEIPNYILLLQESNKSQFVWCPRELLLI